MLLKYRNDYEKVAMGLLSFVPTFKAINRLRTELQWYQASQNRQILLWKDADQDFSGALGVELKPGYVLIRFTVLTPAERSAQNEMTMLDELSDLYPEDRIMGLLSTAKVVSRWEQSHE